MGNGRQCVGRLRAAPFIVAGAYALQAALTVLLPCAAIDVAAQLICTSPIFCAILLWVGAPFNFCKWWKIECLLPSIPAVISILAHFNLCDACAWLAGVAIVLAWSIRNGVMVFLKKKQ